MTPQEAHDILNLPEGASPQQINQAYQDLYNDYHIRLTNAPTSSLKQMYQRNMGELEEAKGVLLQQQNDNTNPEDLVSATPILISQAAKQETPQQAGVENSTSSPQPQTIKEPKKRNVLIPVLLVIIAASLSIGVYLFWQYLQVEQEQKKENLAESTEQPEKDFQEQAQPIPEDYNAEEARRAQAKREIEEARLREEKRKAEEIEQQKRRATELERKNRELQEENERLEQKQRKAEPNSYEAKIAELNREEVLESEHQKAESEKRTHQTDINKVKKRETAVSGVTFELVGVSGGSFEMGSTKGDSDEKPIHTVKVSNFYMGKYEVTQAQWRAVMGNNPSYFNSCGGNCPVDRVSWDDVQEFLARLNQLTGKNYRLPTEAEWEYAARGGNLSGGYMYSGSNTLGHVAWFDDNSDDKPHSVGIKSPNELGLYDMSGNVWEWCSDWYNDTYYGRSPQVNPQGPSTGSDRVNRGGSWNSDAVISRVALRNLNSPVYRYNYLGFRLASSP